MQLKKKKTPKEKQGKVGLVFEKHVEKDIGWWIGFYTSRDQASFNSINDISGQQFWILSVIHSLYVGL